MSVEHDTGKGPEESQPRKVAEGILSRLLGRIAGKTGRIVSRPAAARWTAPAAPPATLARLTALQLLLNAALAGEAHDLEALTAEAWTLTPIIPSRDASVIIGKVVELQQRRTAELNSAIAFMEMMQATFAFRSADDARHVAEIRAQLGQEASNGNE